VAMKRISLTADEHKKQKQPQINAVIIKHKRVQENCQKQNQ